ncbi:MAG TPA: Hsp20/alpha crystallin family protein [Nitrospirota bacterium]|nr:Hsp20/alpha crystallin family protein [Nitrospirota bacterium]
MLWTELDRFGLQDPWRAFERLNRATSGLLAPSTSEFPLVNVWMDGDRAIITSELPGVQLTDVDISVTGKSVTLRGWRATEDTCKGECQHRRERWSGTFTRSIELPYLVDQDKVEARFSKGMLELTLPRAEADKPRKIAIKAE